MKNIKRIYTVFTSILFLLALFHTQATALILNYSYDHLDRLVRVEADDGSMIIDYSYDSVGNRLSLNATGEQFPPYTVQDEGVYGLDATGLNIIIPFYGAEYGNITYSYAIGSVCNGVDYVDWTLFEPQGVQTRISGLNLPYNQNLVISVQIKNFAGDIIGGTGCSNGITALDPLADSDGDGYLNGDEATDQSHPFSTFSTPAQTVMSVKQGFNMINFPAEMLYYETAENFLNALGGSAAVSSIQLFNTTGTFNLAGYDANGNFYGDNFQLIPGNFTTGMIIDAKQNLSFSFTSRLCSPWDLKPGTNLVGTACMPTGKTAFQLLQAIGDATVITSVQRFNSVTGKFETASYSGGVAQGVDFSLTSSDAYLINMKQSVLGFIVSP